MSKISEQAKTFGISRQLLRYRLNTGWDIEKAKTAPYAIMQHKDFPELTEKQLEIITGGLLGDAFIPQNKRSKGSNCCFCKEQRSDRLDYLQWHFDSLTPYSKKIYHLNKSARKILNGKVTNNIEGNWYKSCIYRSCSHTVFTELRKKWYSDDGVKQIPFDIKLTPLSLAIWFCDDGNNNFKKHRIRFSTDAFTYTEIEFLSNLLESTFSIKSYISNEKCGHRLYVRTASYFDFLNVINDCLAWKSFAYKLNKKEEVLHDL